MSLPKLEGPRRMNENVSNRANAEDYRHYLEQGVCEDLSIHYEGCGENWVQDFIDKANLHGKMKNNVAMEFVESWNPEETQKVTPKVLFERSIENAREAFPGHDFVVVPHISENGNFHTHVLFSVISDEGERLLDNGKTRRRWNKVCDAKSREHGLSTVQRTTSGQRERLSRTARKMVRQGRIPYQLQIMRSADFARTISANMNEFISYMGFMGIEVNVRGKKTISFQHERQKRPARGRSLGTLYTKESLDEQFKSNQKQFGSRVNLKESLVGKFQDLHDDSGRLVGDSSNFPFVHGGHKRFEELIREAKETNPLTKSNDNGLGNESRLSLDLDSIFRDVTTRSIPDYCKAQGVALVAHNDGTYSIKGKEYIHIKDNKWTNKKIVRGKEVGTTGSLLHFVCNHKKLGELEAMAFITGNKRLLQLSQYLDMDKRTYREFTIPRQDRMNEQDSRKQFIKLAKYLGRKSEVSKFLYRMKSIQVKTDGTIRFLMGKKANGAVEYKQDSKGNWSKKLLGSLRSGVFSQKGSNNKLRLFKDPFAFMQETGGKGNLHYKSGDNILVLGDGEIEALDFFLAKNPKIQNVELFGFDSKNVDKNLSRSLKGHEVSFTFMESSAKGQNKGLDLSR